MKMKIRKKLNNVSVFAKSNVLRAHHNKTNPSLSYCWHIFANNRCKYSWIQHSIQSIKDHNKATSKRFLNHSQSFRKFSDFISWLRSFNNALYPHQVVRVIVWRVTVPLTFPTPFDQGINLPQCLQRFAIRRRRIQVHQPLQPINGCRGGQCDEHTRLQLVDSVNSRHVDTSSENIPNSAERLLNLN